MVKCCLCGCEIEINHFNGWAEGNNALPLKDGRCCDMCNMDVIQERMRRFMEVRKNAKLS